MLLVCDCNLWLEKDRDFVVMGQMTGRITQAGISEKRGQSLDCSLLLMWYSTGYTSLTFLLSFTLLEWSSQLMRTGLVLSLHHLPCHTFVLIVFYQLKWVSGSLVYGMVSIYTRFLNSSSCS